MSRYFQRPFLRPDTFQDEYYQKSSRGVGLKAAFQTRTSKPLFQQTLRANGAQEEVEKDTLELNHQFDASRKPLGDVKRTHYENFKDSIETKRDSQVAYQTKEAPSSRPSGLKGAFLTRQQSIPSNMEETSSSSSSMDNLYPDHVRYQETYDRNDYTEKQDREENGFPTGYHSIHRLSHLSNQQGGSNLKKAFDARTGGTVRRTLGRTSQKELLERHANIIVSKMEQDEALTEDSPDAEELRRTALRDMPQCLTIKRCVKLKLSKSISKRSKRKPISCWKMFKYRVSMAITKFKINLRDLAYSFELWYEPLKKIEGNFGTGVASFFKFLRWLFLVNLTIAVFSVSFIVIPKAVYGNYGSVSYLVDIGIISDLVTGEGYLTNTALYYGFYTNESVSSSSLSYSVPHAYFFTMLAIYLVSFVVIGTSAAKSYRRSFIETEGGLKNVFANKIFCGWDYNIATKDAADLKSKAIYNEIKELISDFTSKRHNASCHQKFLTIFTQIFMNIFILCVIAATAFAIWYFLNHVPTDRDRKIIVAPVFINTVMTLMPMFLSFVIKYEDYKNPKIDLYLTLSRTFVLGAVTIGVLVAYWLQNDSKSSCWETSLAQEFYRMIVFDFFISVVCTAILDICLFLIYKYLRKNTYLEFDIAWNTMQIIYNQTLFWVGLAFSPLLPIVVVVKLFLCWYIRLCIVLFLCKPSAKTWRAAQTTTWFLVMTFLSLLFIGGLVGYIISYIQTSKNCGPFRHYDHIYEFLTLGLLQLQLNSTVWQVVLYVTKPGVIALGLLFLGARVYYVRAQANAQKEVVEQCRNMLVWTAKDKEYYYSMISRITHGQYQYRVYDRTANPHLYNPDLCANVDEGDTIGPSLSNNTISSPISGMTFAPSTSTFSMDADNIHYSRYKKYS